MHFKVLFFLGVVFNCIQKLCTSCIQKADEMGRCRAACQFPPKWSTCP